MPRFLSASLVPADPTVKVSRSIPDPTEEIVLDAALYA